MTPLPHCHWADRHPLGCGCTVASVLGVLGLVSASSLAGLVFPWFFVGWKLLVGWIPHARALALAHPVEAMGATAALVFFLVPWRGRCARFVRVAQVVVLVLGGGVAGALTLAHFRHAWERRILVDDSADAGFEADGLGIGMSVDTFLRRQQRWPVSMEELRAATALSAHADWLYTRPADDAPPDTPVFTVRSSLREGWWVIRKDQFAASHRFSLAQAEFVPGPPPLRPGIFPR